MDAERNTEILTTGFNAAHERMSTRIAMQTEDYPHDFDELYNRAEDELFTLYTAIRNSHTSEMRKCAGNVIVTMSEIVECVKSTGNKDGA
jgi:hypothetical protein